MIGIDLFAGAGGMSLGAAQAGITVELAVELDPNAAKTYIHNHPDTEVHCTDIRRLSNKALARWLGKGKALIVFGGPPCQGFSWSNLRTRNAGNEKNWLFQEFLRVVEILQPGWVIFENVQGIVNTSEGTFLSQISEGLKGLGYRSASALLNAMHYGVPQDRTRFFLVASRHGTEFRSPPKTTAAPPTVDDAICDLPPLENGDSICQRRYGQARPSAYQRGRCQLEQVRLPPPLCRVCWPRTAAE